MATKKATKRKTGDDRRQDILDCAAKLVGKHGAKNVTRRMVAQACKLSEALIAHYFGPIATAQKAFLKHAKKLGIAEPSKEQIAAIGEKLRKKPRKNAVTKAPAKKVVKKTTAKNAVVPKPPRKRSVAEVKAIKDKAAGVRPKTAARAPKAPPALPPLPVPPALPPLPVPSL